LKAEEIEYNPGKKTIYKLLCNAFFGKFGQSSEKMTSTQFVSNENKFFTYFENDTLNVFDIRIYNDLIASVVYKTKSEFVEEHSSSNVVIASFVTAYARIELLKILEKLGDRCLYYDTDSVIFVANPDDWKPPLGQYLGQLTDEVATADKPNQFIEEFISSGPKCYAYIVYDPDTGTRTPHIKLKGIKLTTSALEHISFQSMKNLIDEYIFESNIREIKIDQQVFNTHWTHNVLMRNNTKTYKMVYTKRKIYPSYNTRPFGNKFQCETVPSKKLKTI